MDIKGYTEQSDDMKAVVNHNKEIEERILRRLDEMRGDLGPIEKYDGRWLSIARTHFEQAFMAMNRAAFQPQRIKLPEDV